MSTSGDPARDRQAREARARRSRVIGELPVTECRLDVRGGTTPVLEGGSGPPLVLLHGPTAAGCLAWSAVLPRLAASHRVVVPDLPGLGEAEPLPRVNYAQFADWLAALLPLTCGDERPTLVAHSLPAGLAVRFAARRGDFLRRLVLVDVPAIGHWRPPPALLLAALRFTGRPSEHSLRQFERWPFHDPVRVRREGGERLAAERAYLTARAEVPYVKRTMRQFLRAGTSRLDMEELHGIDMPVGLVWGAEDRMAPVRYARAAQARFGWPLHTIAECGHVPMTERPEAFLSAFAQVTHEPGGGAVAA
ncbi:alpha/beta fold hydrolase [Streptomyces sp. JJ36]|uniref:alpha/beta fold hydrolase n=1 Tax=Streptomyces sp. JJ36 TaxID=2736645 RepID=UPI001F1E1D4E|nr:alpha/beta hydrolase [Streptomyces sp. JJ36]MCF6524824.1 alpha/beta hydrolase [Streptomyces sp. JJ36]